MPDGHKKVGYIVLLGTTLHVSYLHESAVPQILCYLVDQVLHIWLLGLSMKRSVTLNSIWNIEQLPLGNGQFISALINELLNEWS